MTDDSRDPARFIGQIYEAAALPERWPATLQAIAGAFGARGGNLIRIVDGETSIRSSSDEVEDVTRRFAEGGWHAQNSRVGRLWDRATHAGFLTDSDLHSPLELETLPIYAEFLNPEKAAAGAATIVHGARDDGLIIALEGFATHAASRSAVPTLDGLRPHLARAFVLSSQIEQARRATLLEAFGMIGAAVALLDDRGRLLAQNELFAEAAATLLVDGPARVRMCDRHSDVRFATAISELQRGGQGISVALHDKDRLGAAVLHLIPARRDARDLFNRAALFAVLARPTNKVLPQADVISALFDLTVAEARVARAIADGLTPAEIAQRHERSFETVRGQLKRVYAKTCTSRQSELVRLLSSLS